MLNTPMGTPAGAMDRIMLLALWVKYLENQNPRVAVIKAGMGRPTFPMNTVVAMVAQRYWLELWGKSQNARHQLSTPTSMQTSKMRNKIVEINGVSDYENPQGLLGARRLMATALTQWYKTVKFSPNDILFTVSGAGALHNIFAFLNHNYENPRIITPFPHYSLYRGSHHKNHLHPIEVMKSPGYSLTAENLEYAIKEALQKGKEAIDSGMAKRLGGLPKALLLCDPNNPLGTMIKPEELKKIADVLKKYPDILIILDEAYAEMSLLPKQHISLLRIAPELKERIILMRSATKALSAAGERMALIAAFNPKIMTHLIQENIDICGHAPKSLQVSFAAAMNSLDNIELKNVRHYYSAQVNFVSSALSRMGASMPDKSYKTVSTFYVLADLSELIGLPIPANAKKALGDKKKIENDQDIIYSLLFEEKIMLAPLSYFGVDPKLGFVRITCSGGDRELKELLKRIEKQLITARLFKLKQLGCSATSLLQKVKLLLPDEHSEAKTKFAKFSRLTGRLNRAHPLVLKKQLDQLQTMIMQFDLLCRKNSQKSLNEAATEIQRVYRGHLGRKKSKEQLTVANSKWKQFVNQSVSNKKVQNMLLQLTPSERLSFSGWRFFLRKTGEEHTISPDSKKSNLNSDSEKPNLFRAKL